MATEFKENTISSVLKMIHVVFDEISFKRLGFQNKKEREAQLGIGKHVEKLRDGYYQVSLSARVVRENEYEAEVSVTGYCEISEDVPYKDRLLNENAIAILFPYVRAELTLLTAQPETEPLVIPAVNINAMLRQTEEAERQAAPEAENQAPETPS